MMTRRTFREVLLVLAIVGVMAAVAWTALRAAERPRPDIVVYPGSTEVMRQEISTATRSMLSSTASADEILVYYRSTLEGRGFVFAGGAKIPTTIEEFACAWQHDGYIVRFAVMDLDALDPEFVAEHMTKMTTLYRSSVIKATTMPATRPCNILLPGDPDPKDR